MSIDTRKHLSIELLSTNARELAPRNPRQPSARELQLIAQSTKSFGLAVLVLVDRSNVVVSGDVRAQALEKLVSLTEVPVIPLKS